MLKTFLRNILQQTFFRENLANPFPGGFKISKTFCGLPFEIKVPSQRKI